MKVRIIFFVLLVSFFTMPLRAEHRAYESSTPFSQFIGTFIDTLMGSGLKFNIQKVYNEESDKKQGFILVLSPKNGLCEITFAPIKTGTLLQVRTQYMEDGDRLNVVLKQKLKLKEIGLNEEINDSPGGWPVNGIQ